MKLPADVTGGNKIRVAGVFKQGKASSAREKRQAIWKTIYTHEKTCGTQFICTKDDGRLYAVLGETNEILALPPANNGTNGDRMLGYLYQMYGLDKKDPTTIAMYELVRTTAINEGIPAELRRFSAYDKTTRTAYLTGYNGKMWRLDGENVTLVQNGEEGVFFLDDDGGAPIEPDIADHGILIDTLTSFNYENGPSGITGEQQQKFMIVWLFALAFPDLLPDKPIMLLEGLKGSGKTSAVKLIQLALTGKSKIMSISKDQEKDFGVLLLRSPIAILDNMDSYIDWMQDQICRYATEGSFPKRKLFSDDDEVVVRPQSFVAITSRDPKSFRREDVVDRLLIIRLKRFDVFRAAQKIGAHVEDNRNRLVGEYLFHVNRIVAALREGQLDEDRHEQWRMASFASFTRVVGNVFGWSPEEVDEILVAMQSERDVFEGEGDPLVEIMTEWIVYRVRGEPPTIGREYALSQLFNILSNWAKGKGITFYKHHNRLADRLTSAYVARYFRVKMRTDEATGTKFYRIWRVTDPDLDVVDEPTISFSTPMPEKKPIIIRKLGPV